MSLLGVVVLRHLAAGNQQAVAMIKVSTAYGSVFSVHKVWESITL